MGTQQRARQGQRARVLARRERELSSLANRQHGVISRRQLLAAGLGSRTIRRWLQAGRLYQLHIGVYAFGREGVSQQGLWLAAVLAGGEGAVLSHRSAASLWGLTSHRLPVDVTVTRAKRRPGIAFHECGLREDEWELVDRIPATNPARTLLDFAELVDDRALERAFEEADRRRLLTIPALELVCARGYGRRGLKPLRGLLETARPPATRSPLEDQVRDLCREHELPIPKTNVVVLGKEVDVFWPDHRLMVEADSFAFHGHRAAFERDRARDAAMQVAGFRVIRLTHRRIEKEPEKVAAELRQLLGDAPAGRGPNRHSGAGTSGAERGQGTVEWVGLVALVALMVMGLVTAGVRMPGAALAREIASRLLCAASLADGCGDEPALIAAYGTEVGRLVREHMPAIFFERRSRALPVDFRRCRSPTCGDGTKSGLVHRSDAGLPVTAFVHVVDCRPDATRVGEAEGADCAGPRAGNLYLQYWLYYADSATLRGTPIIGGLGYHHDDWESVQIRLGADGNTAERASSHEGYNHGGGISNWGSDAGLTPLRDAVEMIGLRPRNGWGP
ncbi:MAG TPA: type IV toxin-antitoxin system AbiEi family antitoxin domain-containing protein, partial [Candidatus Udaeobacter sp.]|nr:type IV toxin-antitoxin system AbiEi family antitoxin domain-containing protein [Candidatus Udaeobacter sp.]